MTAVNHAGWQVEALDKRMGWRQASKVYPTFDEATKVMQSWRIRGVELRVYEAFEPEPLTLKQWLGEAVKRVKRFYFKGVL